MMPNFPSNDNVIKMRTRLAFSFLITEESARSVLEVRETMLSCVRDRWKNAMSFFEAVTT